MNVCTVDEKTVVFSPERRVFLEKQPTVADEDRRGPVVSHFRLLRQLGQGGMGTVYLAEDLTLGRKVAIKFMDRAAISDFIDDEDDCTVVRNAITNTLEQRFIREAKSAATISHQNLTQIYEAHFDDDDWFIAMEYIDGLSLDGRLRGEDVFSKEDIITIFRQTVLGLKYAWDNHRIVHRDVKPANIMVNSRNRVKIVDLGLAKPLDSEHPLPDVSQCGAALGTPPYASPEQSRAEADLNHLTDIYSLGATLYEICTGVRAFDESTPAAVYEQQLQKAYTPIKEFRTDLPGGLIRLIDKMLAPDRIDRVADYETILRTLDHLDCPDDTVKIKLPPRFMQLWNSFVELDYAALFPSYDCSVRQLVRRPLTLWAMAFMMVPLGVMALKPGPSRMVWGASAFSVILWIIKMKRDARISNKLLTTILTLGGSWALFTSVCYMLITRLDSVAALYAGEMGGKVLPSVLGSFFGIALVEETLKLLPLCLPFVIRKFDLKSRSYLIVGAGIGLLFSLKSVVLFSMENWGYDSLGGSKAAINILIMFAVLPALHGMWTGIAAWFLAASRKNGRTQWSIAAIGLILSTVLHTFWSSSQIALPGILGGLMTVGLFLFYYERTRKDTRAYSRLHTVDCN